MMTKEEMLKWMDENRCLLPRVILEIFDWDEELPDELVELIKEGTPNMPAFIVYTGNKGAEMLKRTLEQAMILRDLTPGHVQRN